MPKIKDITQQDLINGVVSQMPSELASSIPQATATNFADVGRAIMDYEPTANAFIQTLLNKIALSLVKSGTAMNPLARFKKGSMPIGYTIEEIFVDIAERVGFDPVLAETTVEKRNIPELKVMYHSVNRQDMYKTTISQAQLAQAFTSQGGLSNLVVQIVDALMKGDIHDEFQLMKKVIVDFDTAIGFKEVEVVNPLLSPENMTEFVKKTREISRKMTFLSTDYTASGVRNNCPKQSQVILISPELEASMDVDVLAKAFNMTNTEFLAQHIVVDSFGYETTDGLTGALDGAVAILMDYDAFMMYDTHFSSHTRFNEQGLYWNYFLHHWSVLSMSGFNNAVVFKLPTATTGE